MIAHYKDEVFMKDLLTVFVNSCDQYSDAWYPFFKFLDIFGGKLKDYPITLAAEKKDFSYDGLNIDVLKYSKHKTWSQRLIKELSMVQTDFIFFVIEDYFLIEPFDFDLFKVALDYMIANPNTGYMSISNKPNDTIDTYSFQKLDLEMHRLHMTTSIWRTEYFISLLRKHESIWDFERYSHIRARNLPYECVSFVSQNPCYCYKQPSSVNNGASIKGDGYGIVRGKWLKSNVDLFNQYNIEVDFSNLGFYKSGVHSEAENNDITFLKKHCEKSKIIQKIDNRVKKYKRKKEKKKREKSYK